MPPSSPALSTKINHHIAISIIHKYEIDVSDQKDTKSVRLQAQCHDAYTTRDNLAQAWLGLERCECRQASDWRGTTIKQCEANGPGVSVPIVTSLLFPLGLAKFELCP